MSPKPVEIVTRAGPGGIDGPRMSPKFECSLKTPRKFAGRFSRTSPEPAVSAMCEPLQPDGISTAMSPELVCASMARRACERCTSPLEVRRFSGPSLPVTRGNRARIRDRQAHFADAKTDTAAARPGDAHHAAVPRQAEIPRRGDLAARCIGRSLHGRYFSGAQPDVGPARLDDDRRNPQNRGRTRRVAGELRRLRRAAGDGR